MISTTKVLCFVAIAFADSDFQTDHTCDPQGCDGYCITAKCDNGDPYTYCNPKGEQCTLKCDLTGDGKASLECKPLPDAEEREAFRSWFRKKSPCQKKCNKYMSKAKSNCLKRCRRQLDEDEEAFAAVLV